MIADAREIMAEPSPESLELRLCFEGGIWHAEGEGLSLEHPVLAKLDDLIIDAVGRHGLVRRVHVRFDLDRLPVWMRQYQAHYFNYVLTVGGGPERR